MVTIIVVTIPTRSTVVIAIIIIRITTKVIIILINSSFFKIGIHSMQGRTTTTRREATRKERGFF